MGLGSYRPHTYKAKSKRVRLWRQKKQPRLRKNERMILISHLCSMTKAWKGFSDFP